MIVRPNSTYSYAKNEAGGKGFNLYLMSREGLPVPAWVVLGKRTFVRFLKETGLTEFIDSTAAAVAAGTRSPSDAALEIETRIVAETLPASIEALLRLGLSEMGADSLISVRSSAADEDGMQHSFAGQLSSFLYVSGYAEAERSLKRCWASGFSERALAYRLANGIDLSKIRVAVVLQKMIDAEKSGVFFTCDPIAKDIEQYLVSSVYGVGEGLVSGALDADSFWLNSLTGTLERSDVVEKKEMFKKGSGGECQTLEVAEALRAAPSLDGRELTLLHDLGRKLMSTRSSPQDVEWAMAGGQLYLLQTRPVTTLDQNLTGYPNLWDNSNIVESYGGLTSPLSFTFALQNYRQVYIQFCEILTVPQAIVKDMDYYLRNMLGSIHGRVYYNLYNWYKLVGVLPGFRNNRSFMETMMGVSEELSPELANRISPHPSWDTWKGKIRQTAVGLKFLYYHFRIQKIVDDFLIYFNREYLVFRNRDFTRMSSDQIFASYLEMDRKMLSQWKAPIINDFLCMIHFGVLKKLTEKWLAELGAGIQNDLLAGEGGLESAEPTKTLIRMAGYAAERPALKGMLEETDAGDLMECLTQSPHLEFLAQVLSYIDRFGFRCMSEMKLEETDLFTDPSYLFVCLKNYLRSGTTDIVAYERREKELRRGAEAKLRAHLGGLRKLIYGWSLKHARKAVKNRENTRFSRTRAYGVGRSMFRAMGHDLAGRGILKDSEDVFFLTLDEIYGIHQGTISTYSLKDFIDLRKRDYATYEELEPKPRFQTRGPVYWQNSFLVEAEETIMAPGADYDLIGLPCCPGVVEGIIKVVKSPKDDLTLNGEILVTSRTDPGWVPLYPSISGLLIERGSLLSHSAIVAREMGLPAIVGIKGLLGKLESGMRVRMDAKAGTIKIIK